MEFKTEWKEGMVFQSNIGHHLITMDAQAPLGHDQGANPKELLAAGLAGCIGMDMVGLLRKYKQNIRNFEISTKIDQTFTGYPIVFSDVELIVSLDGEIDSDLAVEAARLAHTKYCGVSAMLSPSVPIHWRVILNGREVGRGVAEQYLSAE